MRKYGLLLLAAFFMAMAGCGKKNPVSGPPLDSNPKEERWVVQTSGTTNFLNAVHFLNKNEGWAAGANATLLHTNDGGANWSTVNTTTPSEFGFNAVRFIDRNIGWVGGLQAVMRTMDGGTTWGGFQFSNTLYRYALFPVSATVAWAIGPQRICCATAHFRFTFNSDGSFTQTVYYEYRGVNVLRDIFFIDSDNGWSVGDNGMIFRISNASGNSPAFTVQTSGTAQTLWGIQMLNATTGWIAGNMGTLLKTTDGGNTWTTQTSKTTIDLNAISFLDASRGIAVGDSGKILSTTDGGASWTSQESGTTNSLRGIHFVDVAAAYAVGANGAIFKRTTVSVALAKESWKVSF